MDTHEKHPLSYSISELAAVCHSTSARSRESYVGLFTRVFSIRLTRLLLCTPVTPNTITAISVVVYFAGLSFFYFSTPLYNAIGCFFIFFSIVLDGCDGEIARFRKTAGVLGGRYVEPVSHDIQYGLGFVWLAYVLVLGGGSPMLLLLGAFASVTKLMTRLLRFHFVNITRQEFSLSEVQRYVSEYHRLPFLKRLYDAVEKNLFSSTSILLVCVVGTVLNRIDWVVWYYGVGYSALWLLLFLKQIRDIRRRGIV